MAPNYLFALVAPCTTEGNPTRTKSQHNFNKPPLCKLKSYGERSFTIAAPTKCSKLPLEIKLASSVDYIKSNLKTNFFCDKFLVKTELDNCECLRSLVHVSYR